MYTRPLTLMYSRYKDIA